MKGSMMRAMRNAWRLIGRSKSLRALSIFHARGRGLGFFEMPSVAKKRRAPRAKHGPSRKPKAADSGGRSLGTFTEASYTNRAGTRRYKLFVPAAADHASKLPLLIMLHGCSQNPDDFAVATRMNKFAADYQCLVAYPEQAWSANGSRCWNWFRASDQQRDQGEPAIIAGITRDLIKTYDLDATRVYIAGLSAGGAMAAVMGRTYPELYAAVGVHSGLPYAAATDAMSAFAAMKGVPTFRSPTATAIPHVVPTIIVHGDRDKTVHHSNGQRLARQYLVNADSIMPGGSDGGEAVRSHRRGERPYTHTTYRDDTGEAIVEYWLVHGGGHAWFGGDSNGSHTDPKGPDASQEMMRFFSEHHLEIQQAPNVTEALSAG